jgi:Sec7-like guanine-nucleotide exchange factor
MYHSGDAFHVRALKSHIEQFDFLDDPLDVALRKLLMDVALPRETQQIDRVIEAFANRYLQCNPSLFISDGAFLFTVWTHHCSSFQNTDHPYILAFSLIMLHTDAFNKSNKRKMTKADYRKNTGLPGIASEVLDVRFFELIAIPRSCPLIGRCSASTIISSLPLSSS